VSISTTIYEQLFTEVFCTASFCLQFGFIICWQKKMGAKAAHKMLVKLATGVNKAITFLSKKLEPLQF
jgi:hypothetical protein